MSVDITDTLVKTQDQIVQATKKAVTALEGTLPSRARTLPLTDRLPKLTEAVDAPFALAQKLLDNQRGFAKAIAGATSPLVGQKAAAPSKAKSSKAA